MPNVCLKNEQKDICFSIKRGVLSYPKGPSPLCRKEVVTLTKQTQSNTPLQWFFAKTLSWGFWKILSLYMSWTAGDNGTDDA